MASVYYGSALPLQTSCEEHVGELPHNKARIMRPGEEAGGVGQRPAEAHSYLTAPHVYGACDDFCFLQHVGYFHWR